MQTSNQAAAITTVALNGLDTFPAQILASRVARGAFTLIGVPEAQARETRVRVRAALQQLGIELHQGIAIEMRPEGTRLGGAGDVAIALAVLALRGRIALESLASTLVLGELSLTGGLRPVRGVLPLVRGAVTRGFKTVIVPPDNAHEAASVHGARVLVARHLSEIVEYFAAGTPLEAPSATLPPKLPAATPDMAEIRGHAAARRAVEIAAAGHHPLLMIGPPGAGKTMLARRLAGIMPPLAPDEALEVTAIHSVAGLLPLGAAWIGRRPFRAPHFTVSTAGMVGGGDPVRPGEVSLAHTGVLFLDEIVEFRYATLEALRTPLDDGFVTLMRAKTRTTFPARPLIVGAMNPCPCGFLGDPSDRCKCSEEAVKGYRAHMRGVVFKRFDLHVVLAPVDVTTLQSKAPVETTAEVQTRVIAARQLQAERMKTGARANGELSARELEQCATPDAAGARVLAQAVERLGLSASDYGRVLRVARTIADLDGSTGVLAPHVAEAIHARLPCRWSPGTPSRE